MTNTTRDQHGNTPLHTAIENNNINEISQILTTGNMVELLSATGSNDVTPMSLALTRDNANVLNIIINELKELDKADFDQVLRVEDSGGNTALYQLFYNVDSLTRLFYACGDNKQLITNFLSITDKYRQTIFHWIADAEDSSVADVISTKVKALDLNISDMLALKDKWFSTAIHDIIISENAGNLQLIVDLIHKTDLMKTLSLTGENDLSMLHLALNKNKNPEILKIIIDQLATLSTADLTTLLNLKDDGGNTAIYAMLNSTIAVACFNMLMNACNGNKALIEKILSNPDKNGDTLLHWIAGDEIQGYLNLSTVIFKAIDDNGLIADSFLNLKNTNNQTVTDLVNINTDNVNIPTDVLVTFYRSKITSTVNVEYIDNDQIGSVNTTLIALSTLTLPSKVKDALVTSFIDAHKKIEVQSQTLTTAKIDQVKNHIDSLVAKALDHDTALFAVANLTSYQMNLDSQVRSDTDVAFTAANDKIFEIRKTLYAAQLAEIAKIDGATIGRIATKIIELDQFNQTLSGNFSTVFQANITSTNFSFTKAKTEIADNNLKTVDAIYHALNLYQLGKQVDKFVANLTAVDAVNKENQILSLKNNNMSGKFVNKDLSEQTNDLFKSTLSENMKSGLVGDIAPLHVKKYLEQDSSTILDAASFPKGRNQNPTQLTKYYTNNKDNHQSRVEMIKSESCTFATQNKVNNIGNDFSVFIQSNLCSGETYADTNSYKLLCDSNYDVTQAMSEVIGSCATTSDAQL